LKIKNLLFTLLFIALIFFGSISPGLSLDLKNSQSVQVEKSDSSEVKKTGEQRLENTTGKNESHRSESSSKISYNIIYYLIAKFILINPFSRPS
jgi:hypothetical protein